MSKKLLMNTYNNSFGYVQEGLILNLDSLYNTRNGFNANTKIWEDISGNNNDFSVDNDNIIFTAGNVYIKQGGCLTLIDLDKFNSCITNKECMTLQIIADLTNEGNTMVKPIFISCASFGYYTFKAFISSYNDNGFEISPFQGHNRIITVEVYDETHKYNNSLYINMESIPKNSQTIDYFDNTKGSYIGRNGANSNFYQGNIKAIRLYQGKLTQNDLLQNYNNDKLRYKI